MEGHNSLNSATACDFYRAAKERLIRSQFQLELASYRECELREFGESDLLREAAWVILCSGFRESVVRGLFSYISACFCEWESAATICENAEICRATAMSRFRNSKKIDAVVKTATHVNSVGFERYKVQILQDPISTLQLLPYIGPITAYHLAKNLGADVAKPDRHLSRFAARLGFADVQDLCSAISRATGDSRRLVDLILWRSLEQGYKFDGIAL